MITTWVSFELFTALEFIWKFAKIVRFLGRRSGYLFWFESDHSLGLLRIIQGLEFIWKFAKIVRFLDCMADYMFWFESDNSMGLLEIV